MNDLFCDIGYYSLNKDGETLCGDRVQCVSPNEDDEVIVLAERAIDTEKVEVDEVNARLAGFEDQLGNMAEGDARRAYLYNEIAWCKLLLAQ